MQALAIDKSTLLQGKYRLLEAIGGRESRVYLAARETSACAGGTSGSPRVVARLWQPSAELLHAHGAQALFERALAHMRSATLLRHPILAMAETCGVLDEGTLFLISEHYEGVPLDTWLDSAGIPPLPTVIDLGYRVCSGLNAAHRNGLSHASLHPRSVIVRPPTETSALSRVQGKLIDFGAPTCMFSSPPSLHAARFMAPEQLELALRPAIERGEPTVRMNVYGCGALLYYLCTGGPPLPGKSVEELMVAHAAHKVLPPSRINPQVIPALDAIILKALEAHPRARYANAAELANALISIRFERSSSGVRHRAPSDQDVNRTPQDRRVTIDLNADERQLADLGLEERPTSKAPWPPKSERTSDESLEGFAFDKPTAVVPHTFSIPTPLPPLTPPPPSMPPEARDEDITAQTPLPVVEERELAVDQAQLHQLQVHQAQAHQAELILAAEPERSSQAGPPAVRARPARHSLIQVNDWIGHVPAWAYIALAAAISLSVIYAVITRPSAEHSTISVTPLPYPATPRALPQPAPAPPPSDHNAGASAVVEASLPKEPAKRGEAPPEPRATRATRPPGPTMRTMPAREEPHTTPNGPGSRPQLEPVSEPEQATPRKQPEIGATEPALAPRAAPSSVAVAPEIAPLPEPRVKPLSPLPEKAVPRFYDVHVKGSLATSQVRRGIERTLAAMQDCYRDALNARPTALSELSVEVVVDERGRARSARVTGKVPGTLQRCVESAALRLGVQPPDTGTVTATWKVSL